MGRTRATPGGPARISPESSPNRPHRGSCPPRPRTPQVLVGHTSNVAPVIPLSRRYRPDVVLLMCGTNDLWYRPSTKNPEKGGNVTQVSVYRPTPHTPSPHSQVLPPPCAVPTLQVLGRINSLLDQLYAVVPNVTVLLSTVSDINATKCLTYIEGACPPDMPTNIAAVNSALPASVVAPAVAAGRKVFLHDVNADAKWVNADYFTWGIHRSQAGFKKMAASWFSAISAHVTPPSLQ